MKKILGVIGVVSLLFAGCSSEDDILSSFHNDPNAVHITAEVGKASADGFTRSNPLGDAQKQKQFNENDEISVKADGQEAVTYKLDGEEWVPQGGKFLKWESETMKFTAYYPASYTGGAITQPTAYPDEASLIAADYMSFTNDVKNPGDNSLTLTMNRQMARVVVEIVGFNNQYAQNTTVNSVTINGTVKALKQGKMFYALMVPCSAQNDKEFLSLEVGTGNTKETLKGIPALEAGKSYTYQLTVGKNKVVVSGITVANWTTGEITGGKAELYAPYITFTAEGEQTFMMTTEAKRGERYEISELEYSLNNDVWKKVVENNPITFGGNNSTLRLRGKNHNGTAKDSWNYATITFDKPDVKVTCTGDIRTLLDHESYKTVATDQARFCYLFENCKALTSAPDLPAETLADNCYQSMFRNCTNLVNAPALPAETLNEFCYENMFEGCTNLKTAPVLPAKSLKSYCYYNMFLGCTSLENAPALLATVLAESCYSNMFENCTSLESAPELPATKLAESCYEEMFVGCKKLSSVTMLAPSDQIEDNFFSFNSWLADAGTSAATRTLKVTDADAYNALANNRYYLPSNSIWKKGTAGTTVKDKNNKDIQ